MIIPRERVHTVYWLAAFFGLNITYFMLIFGSFGRIRSCCDAVAYYLGGLKVANEGLLADVFLSGYRSVWSYANVALISAIGDAIGFRTQNQPALGLLPSYAAGSLLLFGLIGCAAIFLFQRYRGFSVAFSATFLNPLTLANVPIPVQESQMALVLVPLSVAAFLLVGNGVRGAAIVTLATLCAAAWMIKSSFILVALPLSVFTLFYYRWNRAYLSSPRWTLAISGLVVALIIGPQIIVSMVKFGSPYPYPVSDVLSAQLSFGHRMWKWETVIFDPASERAPQGRAFLSPFGDIAPEEYLPGLLADPLKALALIGVHVLAAFDYTHLKIYIDQPDLPPFSLNNVLVGFLLFTGLSHLLRSILDRSYRSEYAHLDILFFGIVVVFPILAVETRFSFLPMISMTFRSLSLFRDQANRSDRIYYGVMGVLVGFLLAAAVAMLYGTAELV